MRLAVVDVGTNSVRLLVADADPATRALVEIERHLDITRLGEGVDEARVLGDEPLRRTVEAISRYAEAARAAGAEAVRIIATSAVRDAGNRDRFVADVREASGIDPDVLTGDEEARLGFAGATIAIDAPGPYLIVDIGGGSTELVRGSTHPERFISLDVGSVRLTERHVRHDPPTERELEDVRADAAEHLARARAAIGPERPGTLVGLAGTITTGAAVSMRLERYDRSAIHRARLARADVDEIARRLSSMTRAERAALPVMPPGREDVIVAGLVILQQVMETFSATEVVVSETDILDGAMLDLLTGIGR